MILGFFRFVVWALVAVFIVQMGWDEPLSYRVKSPVQVAMDERLYAPPPPPQQRSSMQNWQPLGTALDRAAYRRAPNGDVLYNQGSVDAHRMGTSTETDPRANIYHSGQPAGMSGFRR